MSQAERKPHMRRVVLTEKERTEFDKVIEEYKEDNSYTDFWGEEVLLLPFISFDHPGYDCIVIVLKAVDMIIDIQAP